MQLSNPQKIVIIVVAFIALFYLPVGSPRFDGALLEAFHLAKWYAREHVLLCLLPAFFIAGAIGVFVSSASVMKYLGPKANKVVAYGVASVSGSVLAVCSCTVLPLFGGIYRMGAGLGPACAFLYSGPAINVLAIIMTARILGPDLGIARALGAVVFSLVIGLAMGLIFRKEEETKLALAAQTPEPEATRSIWITIAYFAAMILILVFANWGAPDQSAASTPIAQFWSTVWELKWWITSLCFVVLCTLLVVWFGIAGWQMLTLNLAVFGSAWLLPLEGLMILWPFSIAITGLSWILYLQKESECKDWLDATWAFALQTLPLLIMGVLVAGFLLGRVGHEGIIPSRYVEMLVGNTPDAFFALTGWSHSETIRWLWPLWTNFFAAFFGAFMYFATLTEVPILQGLLGSGMGRGPALALLLAGPALSLPSMLVLRSILGLKKTVVYVSLVIALSTLSGLLFGLIVS